MGTDAHLEHEGCFSSSTASYAVLQVRLAAAVRIGSVAGGIFGLMGCDGMFGRSTWVCGRSVDIRGLVLAL